MDYFVIFGCGGGLFDCTVSKERKNQGILSGYFGEHYARGEITKEEFERMKKDLE